MSFYLTSYMRKSKEGLELGAMSTLGSPPQYDIPSERDFEYKPEKASFPGV